MNCKFIVRVRQDPFADCLRPMFLSHDVDGTPSGPLEPKKNKLTDIKKIHQKWQVAMYEGNGWNRRVLSGSCSGLKLVLNHSTRYLRQCLLRKPRSSPSDFEVRLGCWREPSSKRKAACFASAHSCKSPFDSCCFEFKLILHVLRLEWHHLYRKLR